jgi:hypothetical protein
LCASATVEADDPTQLSGALCGPFPRTTSTLLMTPALLTVRSRSVRGPDSLNGMIEGPFNPELKIDRLREADRVGVGREYCRMRT